MTVRGISAGDCGSPPPYIPKRGGMDAGAREYAHGCAFERKERDVTAELRWY